MKDFILGNIIYEEEHGLYSMNIYPNTPYYKNRILFNCEPSYNDIVIVLLLKDTLPKHDDDLYLSVPNNNKILLEDSCFNNKFSYKDMLNMCGKSAIQINKSLSKYILKQIKHINLKDYE